MRANICVFIVGLTSSTVVAHPFFQDFIPNGKNIYNPCSTMGGQWDAVGHTNPDQGGGDRLNPFGVDFASGGRQWTTGTCQKDSDGDGRTNGQELGDPDCVWAGSGTFPATSKNLGHPGICEPITSAACKAKNTFLNDANCDALRMNIIVASSANSFIISPPVAMATAAIIAIFQA